MIESVRRFVVRILVWTLFFSAEKLYKFRIVPVESDGRIVTTGDGIPVAVVFWVNERSINTVARIHVDNLDSR